MSRWWEFARDEIEELEERVSILEASQAQNQAQIDQEAQAVAAIQPKLQTVQQEVDALKASHAAGQALDFTGLDAAVSALNTQADTNVADAQPAQPAPAPQPTPPQAPNQP